MKSKSPQTYFFKKVIPVPIFYGNLVIIFSNDQEKIRKVVGFPGNLDDFAYTFHNFMHKGKESIAIVLNFWTIEPVTMGTVMHEVNHAGNILLRSRGVIADYDNDEAESYVKSWMAERVQIFMDECGLL